MLAYLVRKSAYKTTVILQISVKKERINVGSRGSVFSIATVLRSEVRVPVGVMDFSLLHKSTPALGPTQPPLHWAPGFFAGGKAVVP